MSCWYYMKRRQEEENKMAESGVEKDITPVVEKTSDVEIETESEVTKDKPIVVKKNSRKKKEV